MHLVKRNKQYSDIFAELIKIYISLSVDELNVIPLEEKEKDCISKIRKHLHTYFLISVDVVILLFKYCCVRIMSTLLRV